MTESILDLRKFILSEWFTYKSYRILYGGTIDERTCDRTNS